MRKLTMLAVGCALLLTSAPRAQQNALQAAAKALGADRLYSLQVAGSGAMYTVGQPYSAGGPWPRVNVKSYTAWYNFDTSSMRLDLVREMPSPIPQGGGVAFAGQQTQNLFYSGNYAWNGFPPAPPPPPPPGAPPAGGGGGGGGGGQAPARGGAGAPAGGAQGAPARGGAAAAPEIPPGPPPQPEATVAERRLTFLSTPQAFVKAAIANNATTRAAGGNTEVSFMVDKKYRMTGTINAAGDVLSVRTAAPNPVFGDMAIETTYSGYKDFGGVRFPSQITQTQGGQPAFEISVNNVTVNPVVSVIIPASVYMAPANAPITVTSQEVAPGVFYLTGGSHHSMAINQRDHIVIVDLPLSIERGDAVIAKAKELIPNKPVRYVINTHVHFDHSSGLRAGVAEGATLVTHSSNAAFYSRALGTRATLSPDKAAAKPVKVQGVGARGSITDGTRRIEMYQITPNNHNLGFLMVYLPAEKILFEADAYTPGAANAPLPTAPVPNAQALSDSLTKLKLDVAQILPAHGPRVATMADLNQVAAIGRK